MDINDTNSFRTVGNVFAEADLSDVAAGLSFRTDFGIDRGALEEFQRFFETNSPGGSASKHDAQLNKFLFRNTLNYTQTFDSLHTLSALTGMSYEQTDVRQTRISGTGFLSDKQLNVTSASTPGTSTSTTSGYRLSGLFARGNYVYDNKYIAEASLRRDGSSRFGMNNRYGLFWSIGGAWVLSQEDFMPSINWLNSLKFSLNYGMTGNDRIGDFTTLSRFQEGIVADYNGTLGLLQITAQNPNLRWEKSTAYNIGVEAALLMNRLSLAIHYYHKKTTDLILDVPIPLTNGGQNTMLDNIGAIQNKGIDIDITSLNYHRAGFLWSTSLALSFNNNKVLSLPNANIDAEGRRFVAGSTSQRAIEGHSVNSFYLIRYVGVNPTTGDAEWLDANGNATTQPTTDDRMIVGDANPDVVGGIRNTIRYQDWDLTFLINFSYGNDIYDSGLRFIHNPSGTFNKSTALLNGWQKPGDSAFLPATTSTTFSSIFSQRSTAQLKNGSYARLKNLTLSYNFSQQLLDQIGFFQAVRLYFTAQNILTIKGKGLNGIDPEVTSSLSNGFQGESFFVPSQARTLLLGAQLSF